MEAGRLPFVGSVILFATPPTQTNMGMRSLLLFVPLLFSFTFETAAAEPRSASLEGTRYLVFETTGADPEAALPMIVGLHYSSAKPEAMVEYFDHIDFPARIVLPQAEYPRRDGYSWFPTDYAELSQAKQDAAATDAERKMAAFAKGVRERHPTRGKPAVMGISYGGDVSFLLAIRHPQEFSASFPVAARFLPTWMPKSNACKPHCPPIRAMHGDADTTVPIGPTRDAVAQLKKAGFDVTLTPYAGVPHDFDQHMERDFAEQARKLFGP